MLSLKRDNSVPITTILLYIWTLLWSINLVGMGTRIAILGGLFFILIYIYQNRKINVSFLIILYILFLFGITFSITINYHEDLDFFRGYRELFIPPILFAVGYLLTGGDKESIVNKTSLVMYKNLFLIITLAFCVNVFINLGYHLNKYGEISIYNRDIYDVWTGTFLATTSQGSRLILIVGAFVSLLFARKTFPFITRVIIYLFTALSLIATIIMANRSIFIIILITLGTVVIYYIKQNSSNINNIVKFFTTMIALLLISIYSYFADLFGIRSYYEASSFYERLQKSGTGWILDNPRIDAWINAFTGIYDFPFGGSKASIGLVYAHNLWLDVAHTAGIIPFILLVTITVIYVIILIRIINNKLLDFDFKLYLFSISIALLLNLMIEPILSGHYHLFMFFIFQFGIMFGLNKNIDRG